MTVVWTVAILNDGNSKNNSGTYSQEINCNLTDKAKLFLNPTWQVAIGMTVV